ncbi:CDP-diacylglycerol diphosphatase [Paraburkholderia bonniea]|uniref:CDP-diacylglycerol diphosphatase n=1 Tax=Paraburkholderia bonniea TaxID=2152891 RepID=UPI0012918F8F|nr:CDP-diacylglycerol diphosphatase [Paraburkholderia bonniea]WJF91837.1 CDP-diacylglycerol diphosphatase [Paraburkholderia bonniea]WJF95156.1 CDP-diacylglycerol diphosphatase [Paraburkholderia bonniea]
MRVLKYMALAFIFIGLNACAADRNILWNKIHLQCVQNYLDKDVYAPCALVDLDKNYTIYKVDGEKYPYLLLPVQKISGIEDAQLLSSGALNYFYLAWQSRTFLTSALERSLAERNISLAINAANARSQDQLHIHISCLSQEVGAVLARVNFDEADSEWRALPEKINGHIYYSKKINMDELRNENLFQVINSKVVADGTQMAYTGAALVNVGINKFVVLVASGTAEQGISAEEIQDPQCKIASGL